MPESTDSIVRAESPTATWRKREGCMATYHSPFCECPLPKDMEEVLTALRAEMSAYEHHDECEDCMDGDLCEVGVDLYHAAYKNAQSVLVNLRKRC